MATATQNLARTYTTDKLIEQYTDVDTFLISISNRQNSGWIMDGTENTSKPLFKDCPTRMYIPNTGRIAVKGENGRIQYLKARYIAGCPFILESEQKEHEYEPSREKSVDKITIDTKDRGSSGMRVVQKDGDLSLFYFLYLVEWNNSAPVRPNDTKGLYSILDLSKQIQDASEPDFYLTDALTYVDGLVTRVGAKVTGYDEKKINSYCTLLGLSTTKEVAMKFKEVRDRAKHNPKQFLDIVDAYENVAAIEVEQAIQLNVIKVDGKVATIDSNNTVIVGNLKGSLSEKIKVIANHYMQVENRDEYDTFKVLLSEAKQKEIK